MSEQTTTFPDSPLQGNEREHEMEKNIRESLKRVMDLTPDINKETTRMMERVKVLANVLKTFSAQVETRILVEEGKPLHTLNIHLGWGKVYDKGWDIFVEERPLDRRAYADASREARIKCFWHLDRLVLEIEKNLKSLLEKGDGKEPKEKADAADRGEVQKPGWQLFHYVHTPKPLGELVRSEPSSISPPEKETGGAETKTGEERPQG